MKNRLVSPLICFLLIGFTSALFPIYQASARLTEDTSTNTDPFPIRKFTIDLDKNINNYSILGIDQKMEGKLKEYSGDSQIKHWKIKLEKKGNSRKKCEPLMFNLTFDKTDSKGNKKQLFDGKTTYEGLNKLEYQELRFVPTCDVWNDFNWVGDVGFKGALSAHVREGFAHTMLRKFGIATSEIVTFADITFDSADKKYNGKTFRYMVMQRVDEQDDQIPFTKQFNLKFPIYEGEEKSFYVDDVINDRLKNITVVNSKTGVPTTLNLDTLNSSRLLMLSEFIGLTDNWFLRNESYATKISDGKSIIIPHSLDSSFPCSPKTPQSTFGGYKLALLQVDDPAVQKIYYNEFQRIFTYANTLAKFEQIADSLPGNYTEKAMLKNYLRLRYQQFATYAVSSEFAAAMSQPQRKRILSLPYGNGGTFTQIYNSFVKNCNNKTYDPVRLQASGANTMIPKPSVAPAPTVSIHTNNSIMMD